MKPSNRVLVALLSFLPSLLVRAPELAAQDPPPCQGGEPYQLIVEVSPDGGSTWHSGSLYYLYGYAGQVVDLPVRTVLAVTSGETQGWSFSLEHDDADLGYYGGSMVLDTVTTSGTHTETVQNGLLPDFDETAVRGSSTGYTQGIIVDNGGNYTLSPPTGTFVTSGACYSFAFPPSETITEVTFRLTHQLGTPPIRTVVTQDGQSFVPCVKDLSVYVASSWSYWSSSSCPTDWTTGSQMSGESSSSTTRSSRRRRGWSLRAPGRREGAVRSSSRPSCSSVETRTLTARSILRIRSSPWDTSSRTKERPSVSTPLTRTTTSTLT